MKQLMPALCALIALSTGCYKPVQPDSLAVQGKWHGVESEGTPGSVSLKLTATTMEFHGEDPREWYKGTYTLHDDTKPKQMTIEITDCPMPKYVGKTALSIYELKGGQLTIVGNEPGTPTPPAAFDAPGSRKIVFKK